MHAQVNDSTIGAENHRKAETERFLLALDEEAEAFIFQTFDDDKARRAARVERNKGKKKEDPDFEHNPLAHTMHGTLDQLWSRLNDLNQQGAGVYVTVNNSVNGRRRAEDINKVRAVFADFDKPENIPETWPLEPVMLVASSPGKLHAYWTVDDLPTEDFTDLQRSIAAILGSDTAVCDLPRVMRLPGFDHCKDLEHRHPVTLVEVNERLPYKADPVKAAFTSAHTARQIQHAPCSDPETATSKQIVDLRSALASMSSDDRERWVRMGHALKRLGDDGLKLWLEWSATSEKYDVADALDRWKGFAADSTGFAAVFAEAQRCGWINPGKVSDAEKEVRRLAGLSELEYEQQRKQAAKDLGSRESALDQMVKAERKKDTQRKSLQDSISPSYPFDSFATGVVAFENPSKTLRLPFGAPLPIGGLLEDDGKGGQRRMIESHAAGVIAAAMRGQLAWDGDAGSWLTWEGTHWEPLLTPTAADKQLADAVHVGAYPAGYRPTYLNGLVTIMQKRGLLPRPACVNDVIPFANGLLDIKTGTLTPATPERALTWVLPHSYEPGSDCPTIKAWLLQSVEDDQETVALLRAWLAALLRGIPLQRFLLLIGRGGSSKGAFQRLAMALIGSQNAAISTLRDLEENRFETAKLYGKRLCMVNEAGKHGGALNMLKSITGGDPIPLERKHVQQTGSFTFYGLVLMATNEDLQSTDSTSGLERRRISISFPLTATAEERAGWEARGGEAAVLHAEIPGLIRWLLEMPVKEIRHRIEHLPKRVIAANLLGMAAGNSVANWMIENTEPDREALTQVGDRREQREPGTGAVYYLHAEDWLYPNYLTWCLRSGRNRPVGLGKFRAIVADMAETLCHPVVLKQHPKHRWSGIKGLKLRDAKGSQGDSKGKSRGNWGVNHCFESIEGVEPGFSCTTANFFATPPLSGIGGDDLQEGVI